MERILVVDDEPEVCSAFKELLSLKGYDVSVAFDGPSALEKVKEVKPHIVLLDIVMPGMGGIEVLKKLKKIDPAIRVIMMTGFRDEELGKRALELGAYDYVTKAADLHYLETALRWFCLLLPCREDGGEA